MRGGKDCTDSMIDKALLAETVSRERDLRVVIAEAVEPVRARLEEMVREQAGLALVTCEERLEALLPWLHNGPPDLLLLGTRLADATSFEALERAATELQRTWVILLCLRIDGSYLVRARELGVDYVLESPRDIDFLPSIMRRLIESRRRTTDVD